ncbi:MAG: flagellar assembly peptidoglycan hydrolase FlgJ, partial [Rhodoferax sp.]|nr:flagellar assembly peptidoglycan hydrolase FlgJ [Rhodoferax sp.]
AIKDAARQFESLFMRELIKSMREATMKSGLLDSPGGDLSADMLDQQMSVQMSGLQGGLSDMIARQLAQRISGESVPVPSTAPVLAPIESTGARRPSDSQSEFVQRHAQAAARVEQSSGIPAAFMLGQAGHETGWGRSEIRMADGSPSHNLFGIKATGGWSGKVAEITTTEYVNGVAQKVVAKFRAYDSYEDSLRDYARLITESPRYAQVSQQTDSVQAWTTGLQRAGYATDPDYASKLSRAINTTLQLQRART